MMKKNSLFISSFFVIILISCQKQEPILDSYAPEFGPPETLIIVEGQHFNDIRKINFNNDVPADFNPSYGAEHAILFRVPENAPLGENTIKIETSGGTMNLPFRVTLEAPKLNSFYPDAAPISSNITILGENFFEPIEVLFHDSIPGEIQFLAEDSLIVKVPEGAEKGFITLKADGGKVLTNKVFLPTIDHLISDFDGNGLHADASQWLFYGNINETASTAVGNNPAISLDGNYLTLSGKDENAIWLGGFEHLSASPDIFNVYDINSDLNNTFLEFDYNNNGRDETVITIILKQRSGSFNDFSTNVTIDEEGWTNVSLPLNRFEDLDGLTIDPQDIKVVKIHLINPENSPEQLEINIDNFKFVEVN